MTEPNGRLPEPDVADSQAETPASAEPTSSAGDPGSRPMSNSNDRAASAFAGAAQAVWKFLVDVVMGRRISGLLPTAPYVLRGAGIAAAAAAFLFPVLSVDSAGALNWLVGLFINLLFAYLLFVAADAIAALNTIADSVTPSDSTDDG